MNWPNGTCNGQKNLTSEMAQQILELKCSNALCEANAVQVRTRIQTSPGIQNQNNSTSIENKVVFDLFHLGVSLFALLELNGRITKNYLEFQ
jgi:hypothetical protein